jgi:hypothetical protein
MKWSWSLSVNPDGSPLLAGEVTGYQIGIRPASGVVGTYPVEIAATPGVDDSVVFAGLAPGNYFASVRAMGPTNSPWDTSEIAFTVPVPVPAAPTNFSRA